MNSRLEYFKSLGDFTPAYETPENNEETFFKGLLDAGICFAVVVSRIEMKLKSASKSGVEYHILTLKQINKKFLHNEDFPRCFEYQMTETEIEQFKQNQEKFNKVLHNESGRVYELPYNSFLSKYRRLKHERIS